MSEGLISIIMPVYGVERYIAQAIRSVQSQTYSNWELIVVNDGTKDRSREIAADFAVADKRIKIVDKENGGLSDARNVGLKHVTGEYVNFFDSDDWLEPDFLENLAAKLEVDSSDMAVCGYYVDIIDSEGNLISRDTRDIIPSKGASASEYFYLMERFLNFAWNKLYRREFIEKNGLKFEKSLWLIEDCEFISRVLPCRPKISFINYAGYHYVQRQEVTLSKKFNTQVVDFIRRKMTLYQPVLSSLGAPQEIVDGIYEDMRAYSSVYLIKQMVKSLDYKAFRTQVRRLYEDTLLNPGAIRLNNCRNKVEIVIMILAKLRQYRLIHFCTKR